MHRKTDPFVEILRKEFAHKKMRNKGYSLRSFARHLSMDSSNLAKILNDQLIPGERLKRKIAEKIGLESQDLYQLLRYSQTEDSDYSNHDLEVFNIVSDWYHYAILELLKLPQYHKKVDVSLLAKDLGISKQVAEASLERLVKMRLLRIEQGTYENTAYSSSSIINTASSKAHRNQQRQVLEMAIAALEQVPVEKRSQCSMTLAIDSKKLPLAQKMIKQFQRKLGRFLSDSDRLDDVYHLSISLYPTTTFSNKNKGESV